MTRRKSRSALGTKPRLARTGPPAKQTRMLRLLFTGRNGATGSTDPGDDESPERTPETQREGLEPEAAQIGYEAGDGRERRPKRNTRLYNVPAVSRAVTGTTRGTHERSSQRATSSHRKPTMRRSTKRPGL